MHTNTVFAEENRQLRAENARQKKKRAIKRAFIQFNGVFIVQQGIDLVGMAGNEFIEEEREPRAQQQLRIIRMCSICRSTVYNARTCPERIH